MGTCGGKDCFNFDASIAFSDRNPTQNSTNTTEYEDDSDGYQELTSDEEECPDQHDFDFLKGKKFYQFLRIPDGNGKMRLVKNSTVVWFCETSLKRLSNDRIYRVREPTPHSPNRKTVVDTVECNETLDVGNWVIFCSTPGSAVRGVSLTETKQHLFG
jgi:hypothetical protein